MDKVLNWKYIAGFFDGNGSILANIVKHKGIPTCKQLQMRMYSKNYDFLYRIKVYINIKGTNIRSTRQGYVLCISSKQNVKLFLEKVMPYIIFKKEKCQDVYDTFDFNLRENNL